MYYYSNFHRVNPHASQQAFNEMKSKIEFEKSWANDPSLLKYRAEVAAAAAAAAAAAHAKPLRASLPRVAKKTTTKYKYRGGSKYRRTSKRKCGCKSGRF